MQPCLERCPTLPLSHRFLIHMLVAVVVFYHHLLSTPAVAATSTYNFIANQRPRFQIPHGNLSYYRSPQWEILYYLKFGTFPFYTSSTPYLNRTQYLNKIRMIKTLMDRKDDAIGAGHELGAEHNETNNGSLVTKPEQASASHPVYSPQIPHQQGGEDINYHTGKEFSKNFYNPLAQLKKNINAPAKVKRDGNAVRSIDIITTQRKVMAKVQGVVDVDYFLVDGDPAWAKHRLPKHLGIAGGRAAAFHGMMDESFGTAEGIGSGMSDEMNMERKYGRKFQTQGWKK